MFYWTNTLLLGGLLSIIPIAILTYKRTLIRSVLVIGIVLGNILLSFPISKWYLEVSLKSFFKEDFRYWTYDYDRAVIDRINVYTLNPSDLNHILNKYHDACVEAYINAANTYGNMVGFKWYRAFYFYNDNNASGVSDMLNLEKLWGSSELKEGRCTKPSIYY